MKTHTMKTITIISILALMILGCESLGTAVEGLASLGILDPTQAAVAKAGVAVIKSFEDITPDQEYYIGRAVAATIFGKYKPYKDSNVNSYLNLLGVSLAYASDRPQTYNGYHFQVLDSEEINAFAAPSGLIMVSRGLLRCAKSEDEVAAILAHEIEHVALKHGLEAIQNSRFTSAATGGGLEIAKTMTPAELQTLTSAFGGAIEDIANKLITSGYSRGQESEADRQAVILLDRAGYDPMALVRMLEVMKTKLTPGGLDFAKTHPEPEERIADVNNVLKDLKTPAAPPAARASRYKTALGKI